MKKLNRKGYMTVEIIIASVIAFAIAFFLMEITIKLVDMTDNEYVNTNFMTDKALIMKNIKKELKSDIGNYDKIESITCINDNKCIISFERSGGPTEERRIVIDKENNIIKYTTNSENGTIYYSKELDSSIKIKSLDGGIVEEYIYFQIKGDNIFSNEIYDINIVVYNG